jgi:hypothetical protein
MEVANTTRDEMWFSVETGRFMVLGASVGLATDMEGVVIHLSSRSLVTRTTFTGVQKACRESCGQGGGAGVFCLGRQQIMDFSWGLAWKQDRQR